MPNTGPEAGAEDSPALHVLAGVVRDREQRILIARRPAHKHQGGLWEFPGGKRHEGEGRLQALQRELDEELGLQVRTARPLIRVQHDYPDLCVDLDVWAVTAFSGVPRSREGQAFAWVAESALDQYAFPAANLPILKAVRLPPRYWITPDLAAPDMLLQAIERALAGGARMLLLRAPSLAPRDYADCAKRALALVRRAGARLLLHENLELAREIGADGVHWRQATLMVMAARSDADAGLLQAASCHDADSLARAERLGVDFACLSPVRETASHPGVQPMGWDAFGALVHACGMPVYALGGMRGSDLEPAWAAGAQGIAGIRSVLD